VGAAAGKPPPRPTHSSATECQTAEGAKALPEALQVSVTLLQHVQASLPCLAGPASWRELVFDGQTSAASLFLSWLLLIERIFSSLRCRLRGHHKNET
jgi:hypothetical protein